MEWPSSSSISAYADLLRAFQWPLVALIISFFFKEQIRAVILRIRKGKILGQEFDIADELKTTKAKVEASAAEVIKPEPPLASRSLSFSERSTDSIAREVLEVASLSPQAGVMLVGSEIEQYLRWIAGNAEYQVRPNASVLEIAQAMLREGVMAPSTLESLRSFWQLRNRIVHQFAGDDKENLSAVDIGLNLLRQLRVF